MRTNFTLMQHHKYTYGDIENMIAWERQVYVIMLSMYLKEEAERIKQERTTRR